MIDRKLKIIDDFHYVWARQILGEDMQSFRKDFAMPEWMTGLKGLWWSAVAGLQLKGQAYKKDGKANYGGATMIFKIYVKRFTGKSLDDIKKEVESGKAGDAVKDVKKGLSAGLRSGDSAAAGTMAKLAAMNKTLDQIMSAAQDENDFAQKVRTLIHGKYLKK